MKLAREPAGQEYSGQTIQLTRAQKLERFGFLFDLYSSFRPKLVTAGRRLYVPGKKKAPPFDGAKVAVLFVQTATL